VSRRLLDRPLGTIPIPNPIANPNPNLTGLAIAAPSYGGP